MSITDFSKFQEKRKAGFTYNCGIIIYWNKNEIPQNVLFIPHKRNFEIPIKEDILLALNDSSFKSIVIYFQGMRWAQSDLLQELTSSEYLLGFLHGDRIIPLDFDVKENNVRLTFGIIGYDTSKLSVMPYFGEPKLYSNIITIDSAEYKLNCSDAPRSFGYTMMYLKNNPENYSSVDIDSLKERKVK